MIVRPIKTHPIRPGENNLLSLIDNYVTSIKENSILVITSKIVSICEGRYLKTDSIDKESLIKKESRLYIPFSEYRFNMNLTIARNLMIPAAGIDESNGDGYYILWPKNPTMTSNRVRKFLVEKFRLKNVGVIITDSKVTPLRSGTSGIAIGFSGFYALKNYIGKKDLFGREMKFTRVNIADSLASAAVVTMGDGDECNPLALITELPFVQFNSNNPSKKELAEVSIDVNEDLFTLLIKSANWLKGDLNF